MLFCKKRSLLRASIKPEMGSKRSIWSDFFTPKMTILKSTPKKNHFTPKKMHISKNFLFNINILNKYDINKGKRYGALRAFDTFQKNY